MTFTKRNHYNPCFWTALWNSNYYECFLRGEEKSLVARDQTVNALNIKSDKITCRAVNDIHYEKNLGVAEITKISADSFVSRHHPDKYEDFKRNSTNEHYPVYIDFEETLTSIEKMPPYKILMSVAQNGGVSSAEEKAFIGCFMVIQLLRSHAIMNSMIEWNKTLEREKFEHFTTLKWFLSDKQSLFNIINPIVNCKWAFYKLKKDVFPLCDTPILVKPNSIMVAISPRLMLEVKTKFIASENDWNIKHSISNAKITEFWHRTIGNTFREIIFSSEAVLRQWKKTKEFKDRVSLMRNNKKYNQLIQKSGSEELWLINSFGNKA
ncbi:MAG: hypothetical protein KZQ83_10270 [gamma proteobacterium symbiont of Taylorina sp.]|nr:hypothetical protein [gamma proteobacterium symbiont of Taylorina sp.]